MTKPAKEVESTLNITMGLRTVRVWRTEPAVENEFDNQDLIRWISENPKLSNKELISGLGQFDRVSAVEVKRTVGAYEKGCVAYFVDWK